MTQLVLEANSFLMRGVNLFVNSISSFFQAVATARQMQANYEVAKLLQREYPKESMSYIMEMIAAGKVDEIGTKK